MSDTTATIVGNLTDDPELRFTPGGAAVANFSVAVNARMRDSEGGWKDGDPSYFRCFCWRGLAVNVVESLAKGDRVIVTGSLKQRSWERPEDGERRSVVELQAEDVGPALRWAIARPERHVVSDQREQEDSRPTKDGGKSPAARARTTSRNSSRSRSQPKSAETVPTSGGEFDATEAPF